ncbi:enoyl-CoA hydratase/isomerase family protein [Chloroflexota bacterium]
MGVDYSTYKQLKVEVDEDGVAIVNIGRPEVLGALSKDGLHEFHHRIFQDLARDETVKAIIVTGEGRGFCSGADVRGMKRDIKEEGVTEPEGIVLYTAQQLVDAMLDIEKPTIAAVNGHAMGLGATIALFCDIIIAAETAKFADSHIKVGLVPGDGGTIIWPLLIGPARAKELLMTGDIIDAKEADRIGLVNRVVPLEDLMPTAKELAKRLAKGPTLAIGWTKRSINKKIKEEVNMVMDGCSSSERISFNTYDHKEGTLSFLEKRPPQFKGR